MYAASTDTGVLWQIPDFACGTVSPSGVYTAPLAGSSCRVVVKSSADPTKSATAVVNVASTAWAPLKVGAGGWITGIDLAACKGGTPAAQTIVARADTYGAYVSDGVAPWKQLVTAASMPASYIAAFTEGSREGLGIGVYEIRVAPSDCTRLYMITNGRVFRSDNRGVAWTDVTGNYAPGAIDGNDTFRTFGGKIAIDPADRDHVLAGSANGLYRSTDGGATWALTNVAAPALLDKNNQYNAGITGIVFDRLSGATAGKTSVAYATSNGRGIFRTTDAGRTWSLLRGGFNSMNCTSHAAVNSAGAYFSICMGADRQHYYNPPDRLHRYNGGAWTDIVVGSDTDNAMRHSIAVHPTNANRMVVGSDGGALYFTADGGATWTAPAKNTRTAGDIPWLAPFASENYMSNGAMAFDALAPDKLWFAEGIGVWTTRDPFNSASTAWTSFSLGIEQLVGTDVTVPPGAGTVVTAGMDRSVWVLPRSNGSYPSRYGVEKAPTVPLSPAWSVAYDRTNPQRLAAVVNFQVPDRSAYSLDGGVTWTRYSTPPQGQVYTSGAWQDVWGASGDVAILNNGTVIQIVGNIGAFRTTDYGATSYRQAPTSPVEGSRRGGWAPLQLPTRPGSSAPYVDFAAPIPTLGVTEAQALHAGFNNRKHVLAVDGGNSSTVYLYFYTHGLYRSLDSGASWTLLNTPGVNTLGMFDGGNMYWHSKLRSVPGRAGHLFLTAGQAGGEGSQNPAGTHLWRSTDGAVTWSQVPGMAEPYDVALGAAAHGASYPTIYVVGWYNGTYGIWRSTDDASSWSQIGPWPNGSLDQVNVLAASQDAYGELYAAFAGSGWARFVTR